MGVLEESRIRLSLVPERHVAEAVGHPGSRVGELGVDPDLARDVPGESVSPWSERVPGWTRLRFAMQRQEQTQWCWAAASVSVARHYDPRTDWTQCRLVGAERGRKTCCADGSTSACNQPHVLDAPLRRVGCLARMRHGAVDAATIRGEIRAGRPLAWRIGWKGGGGHFAVIEGSQDGGDWVAVDDPLYGESDVPLSALTGGTYQGTGTWTHSYFTRRRSPWSLRELIDLTRVVRWARPRAGQRVGGEVER